MEPTASELRFALSYDSETGEFRWKNCPRRGMDGVAGHIAAGYRHIGFRGKEYMAHRLAWLYVTGEWPENEIDHINGDGLDNRLANLRLATHAQNLRNQKKRKNNKSGFKGVAWHTAGDAWYAEIMTGGKRKYLGLFKTKEEAAAAYRGAAETLHGKFARMA